MKNRKANRKNGKARRQRGARRAKREHAGKEKPFSIKAREFVEAIVTAIIFVLVIRQYAAETFDIPTQSMKPTLLGANEVVNGVETRVRHGDHLIADKFYYKYNPVKRFDIVLFKDPVGNQVDEGHLEHRTLIKRIVGLPGDTIEIRHGDLYVTNDDLNGEIPEKSRGVQDALWHNVYTSDFSKGPLTWHLSGVPAVHSLAGEKGMEIDVRTLGRAEYSHRGPHDDTESLPNPVGDLLLEAAVHPLDGSGAVELTIVEDGDRYTFHMPVEGSAGPAFLKVELHPDHKIRDGLQDRFTGEQEKTVSLPVGKTSVLTLTNADDRVTARLDGREIFRVYSPVEPAYRDDTDFAAKKKYSTLNRAALTLDGCHVRLEKVRLDRDVYYTDVLYVGPRKDERGRPAMPVDCRLLIARDADGDLFGAVEKDGRPVREDGRPMPGKYQLAAGVPKKPALDNATRRPYRLDRDEYFAMGDNSPNSLDSRSWGAVPKRYILGKAVFLFWPFPPFGTFRPKLAR